MILFTHVSKTDAAPFQVRFDNREQYEEYKTNNPQIAFDDFDMSELDVTKEIESEKLLSLDLQSQLLGASFISIVKKLNISKQITEKQILEILQDPQIAIIERLAWAGDLKNAAKMIQIYVGDFYTKEDKTYLIESIKKLTGYVEPVLEVVDQEKKEILDPAVEAKI